MLRENKQIGLAIVGSGRIGTLRARVAAGHPSVRFLAVSDLDPERAKALAGEVGAQVASADNYEIISHPQVNAVIVSTSEHMHMEPVIQALELGKPVLVEKPIALDLEQADRILATLAKTKGDLHVGYSRRFKTRYLRAKEQLMQGRLGKIVGGSARVYNTRAQAYQILQRNPEATPVLDALTYYVDLMHWFLDGNRVTEVIARAQTGALLAEGHNIPDVTYAILACADGAVLNLGISYALPAGYPSLGQSERVELLGTGGVMLLDNDHTDQMMYSEQGFPHVYVPGHNANMVFLGSSTPGDWALGEFWGPLPTETRVWLDHIATGKPCALTTPDQARENFLVTLAIEESARTGKPVNVAAR
jgi:predicted dehydrogenase